MRSKTALVMALVLVGVTVFFISDASAADKWYNCTIVRVGGNGATNGAMYVMLTDTASPKAFTNKYFRLQEGRLNQIMAVLLTAASNGSNVRILGDPTIAQDANRLLKAAYLIP